MRTIRADPQHHVVHVFAEDEARCSLLTGRRRRLTARGVQPVGTVQHPGQSCYGDGAVAPTTGDHGFFSCPRLKSTTFQRVLAAVAQAYPDSVNSLILDHSGAHTATRRTIPPNSGFVLLPPSPPALSPIEQRGRAVNDKVGWNQFPDVDAQHHYVAELLRASDAQMLQSLTAYAYVVDAVNARAA